MSEYADRFTAIIDACVLGGALKRNMLLRLSGQGMFRPRWSGQILDETQRAISSITKGRDDGSKARKFLMEQYEEALVTGHEIFEKSLELPDPDDRHVLAAAIATSASVIVTENLKDFPEDVLAPHGITALSSDDFLADTIALDPGVAISALRAMREAFKRPELDAPALIHKVEAQGLLQVADLLSKYKDLL